MLKINKAAEPDFLKNYKKKYNPQNWDDYKNDNIKFELKKYIAYNEQKINENNLCVYCERKIDIDNNDGHIEHIRPRDKFPQYFQEYNNLAVSCNSKNSCGNKKSGKYESKFISPVEENPEEFITYDEFTGEIIPKDERNKERVEYTVEEVLNLNEYNLCRARKIVLMELNKAKNCGYFECISDNYEEYYTLIEFYKKNFR